MSRTAVDATILVAALLTWHEDHERAFEQLSSLVRGDEPLLLPLPALIESYAVMTRLPATHRLAPGDAASLLQASLQRACRLVTLPVRQGWTFLEELAASAVGGDGTYEAQILDCARSGGAERLMTLRPQAFRSRADIAVMGV